MEISEIIKQLSIQTVLTHYGINLKQLPLRRGNAFRYMLLAELEAVQSTGLLRGGRAGETFFTKDYINQQQVLKIAWHCQVLLHFVLNFKS